MLVFKNMKIFFFAQDLHPWHRLPPPRRCEPLRSPRLHRPPRLFRPRLRHRSRPLPRKAAQGEGQEEEEGGGEDGEIVGVYS